RRARIVAAPMTLLMPGAGPPPTRSATTGRMLEIIPGRALRQDGSRNRAPWRAGRRARQSGWRSGRVTLVHVAPASAVATWRPSAVVTVAVFASTARIATRSAASGSVSRRQLRPASIVSRTIPDRATTQQTAGSGEEPAVGLATVPIDSVTHVAPE